MLDSAAALLLSWHPLSHDWGNSGEEGLRLELDPPGGGLPTGPDGVGLDWVPFGGARVALFRRSFRLRPAPGPAHGAVRGFLKIPLRGSVKSCLSPRELVAEPHGGYT